MLLAACYAAVSFAMSSGGYLGTDTGAKVATLDAMVTRGSWEPDLGYWAEDLDPDGRLHPIFDSARIDDGWVHVTTLPMLLAGRPLYDVGGYRLSLAVPMAGAVGAAFAARALARRAVESTRADEAGWASFWIVGLCSPVAIYALDFWEHAPGVACMVAAVAVLGRVLDGSRPVAWSVAAGALLGFAATLRTETFVYALVIVGLACLLLLIHARRLAASFLAGVGAIAGFAVPWLANRALEQQLGGQDRGGRVSGAASSAGLDQLERRIREAFTTLFSVRPSDGGEAVGLLLVVLVVAAVVYQRRDSRVGRGALVVAAGLHLAVIAGGLDFVPGMLVAAPLAVVGLVAWSSAMTPVARYAYGVAVLSLPLVWWFQFLGGARPQWGGRYTLTSCTLLVVLGVVHVVRTGDRRLRLGLLGLSGLVTLTGAAWLFERSHEVDRYFAELVERPEDVIVVRNGFFVREGGSAYAERLWLTAVSDDDVRVAVDIVEESGFDSFATLDNSPGALERLHGAELQGSTRSSVAGTWFYVHSYLL